MDPLLFIYAAIFIATLLAVEGLYYFLRDWRSSPERVVNRRLALIASGSERAAILRSLRRESQDGLSRAIGRMLPFLDRLVVESGMTVPLSRVVLLMVAIAVAGFVGLTTLGLSGPFAAVPAGAASFGIVILGLRVKRKKRLARFAEQLPDALEMIVRSLRAGHPISTAISMVANEMSDPIGSEFGITVDEMTYGRDLDDALRAMVQRVPAPDLQFLAVTIQIQHGIGGNLAEVLANLSKVIRERFQMFAKIRAVSAEGRLSGWLIGFLPLALIIVLNLIASKYYGDMWHEPVFHVLLVIAAFLNVAGQFMIWKMVNFRV